MANSYLVRDEEVARDFQNGFSITELLPGTYDGGVRNYKCCLKAGSSVSPETYKDKLALLFFGRGLGYLYDGESANNITELAFYIPDFDHYAYTVHAVTDMEFVLSVVEMNEWDWKVFNANHIKLPNFRLHSQCTRYVQDCKGPNTEARIVLSAKQLGRVLLGTTRAIGEGTFEKGHPAVHQWTYCVGNSNFNLRVDNGKTEKVKAGDFSFIPAGPDHDLYADPGKEVFYVWYEHFARPKDFVVVQLPGDKA